MEAPRGVAKGPRFRSSAVVVLLWVALALLPTAASAAPQADAGCPPPQDAPPLPVFGDRREAQTFTAVNTGGLTRATIDVDNNFQDKDFLLELLPIDANGAPVNGALASATVPTFSLPTGPVTLDVTFSSPPVVSAGHPYALAVSRPGGNFLLPSWDIHARNPGACPGATWFSSGQAAAWAPEPAGVDFIFQTYVDPFLVKPSGKSGAGSWTLVSKKGRLFARVPGPGKLIVDDANRLPSAARARSRRGPGLVKRTKAKAKRAGDVPLRVELTKRGIRIALAKRKLNIPAGVTYTPRGGEPSTLTFKIRIRL